MKVEGEPVPFIGRHDRVRLSRLAAEKAHVGEAGCSARLLQWALHVPLAAKSEVPMVVARFRSAPPRSLALIPVLLGSAIGEAAPVLATTGAAIPLRRLLSLHPAWAGAGLH